jgi:hypothetical protein
MEVSGQLHAMAALTPGKEHRYPMDSGPGGPQSRSDVVTVQYCVCTLLIKHQVSEEKIHNTGNDLIHLCCASHFKNHKMTQRDHLVTCQKSLKEEIIEIYNSSSRHCK